MTKSEITYRLDVVTAFIKVEISNYENRLFLRIGRKNRIEMAKLIIKIRRLTDIVNFFIQASDDIKNRHGYILNLDTVLKECNKLYREYKTIQKS